MSQFSLATFTGRASSCALVARATVFAPVIGATLTLCSFAHAEPATENAASVAPASAVAAPASAPPPSAPASVAAPSAAPPSAAAPSAPTSVTPPSVAPPASLSADHDAPAPRRVHQGFYLRLGSGPGVVSLRGHGPSGSASITGGGGAGFVTIGGAVVPGLVLAGTLQGISTTADFKGGPFIDATVTAKGQTRAASHQAQASFGMLGLLLDWYPQPRGGWHAGLATGVGAVGVKNLADNSSFAGVNFNGALFGGYDWALGHDFGLGLQLTASGGTRAKLLEDSGDHDTGYRLTPLSLGVQASLLYF